MTTAREVPGERKETPEPSVVFLDPTLEHHARPEGREFCQLVDGLSGRVFNAIPRDRHTEDAVTGHDVTDIDFCHRNRSALYSCKSLIPNREGWILPLEK